MNLPLSVDDFDPNILFAATQHEFKIYGDDNAETWAVVDEVDYHFLIQWKWSWKFAGPAIRKDRKIQTRKKYLRRVVEEQLGDGYNGFYECPETGKTIRNRGTRIQRSLLMHHVIMLRTEILPLTKHHIVVDHRDGNEWNCKRNNLRWATLKQNAKNINGSHAHDFEEDI